MTGKINNRYASAIHSSNLAVDSSTYMSDPDVLGAMGLADKALTTGRSGDGTPVKPVPLAVPLERLFAGDNNAVYDIVRMLADMAWRRARADDVKMNHAQAKDLAQACLAWHRDGACKPCGGRRWLLIEGTTSLSQNECPDCRGTGKMPFERQFRPEHRELARWLTAEMGRAAGHAGPQAMKALAPRLEV
jgi:hypothetical protein